MHWCLHYLFLFKLVGSMMGSIMSNMAGASMNFTEGFFFWTLTINDLCLPTFTKVLLTPSAIQFAHWIPCFSNAPLTGLNIPYAVADLLRHMSKIWVTTLCSSSSKILLLRMLYSRKSGQLYSRKLGQYFIMNTIFICKFTM